MSGEMTARDRVWAGILKTSRMRFKVSHIQREIRRDDIQDDVPNDETIKRVLRAATKLGVLDHTSGSPYWEKRAYIRKRFPVQ